VNRGCSSGLYVWVCGWQVTKGAPQIIMNMSHNADALRTRVTAAVQELADRGFRSLGVGISYTGVDEPAHWEFQARQRCFLVCCVWGGGAAVIAVRPRRLPPYRSAARLDCVAVHACPAGPSTGTWWLVSLTCCRCGVRVGVQGVLSVFDPPRVDTKATIEAAYENGVEVKMITGDQTAIAVETCRMLGMGTKVRQR
jgi:hypothetical protein